MRGARVSDSIPFCSLPLARTPVSPSGLTASNEQPDCVISHKPAAQRDVASAAAVPGSGARSRELPRSYRNRIERCDTVICVIGID